MGSSSSSFCVVWVDLVMGCNGLLFTVVVEVVGGGWLILVGD